MTPEDLAKIAEALVGQTIKGVYWQIQPDGSAKLDAIRLENGRSLLFHRFVDLDKDIIIIAEDH